MVEIWCQGANLVRIFAKFSQTQAPFAEVCHVLGEGLGFLGTARAPGSGAGSCEVLGRTRPHEGGNQKPRWDGPTFVVDPSRSGALLFRVLIGSVLGEVVCGEGSIELPTVLRQSSPCTVQLQRKGETTGFLLFSFRASALISGPLPAAPAGGAADSAAGAQCRVEGPASVLAVAATCAPMGKTAANQVAASRPESGPSPPQHLQQPAAPSPWLAACNQHVGFAAGLPSGWASAVDPESRQPYYYNCTTGESQWEPPAVEALQHRQVQSPEGLELGGWREVARGSGASVGGRSPAFEQQGQGKLQQPQPQFPQQLQAPQQQLRQPQQPQQPPQRQRQGDQLPIAAAAAPPQQKQWDKAEHDAPSKLGIREQGKREINALMQSKDRMRDYAERPFLLPAMRGRSRLNYHEFRAAIRQLLAELHIVDVPGDEQTRQMFDKFGGARGGVSREDFEAMLFRLLCFMLAQGDVSVTPGQACTGEERDKRWREECLKKNQRRFTDVYEFRNKLGEGTFGTVSEVAHRTSTIAGGACVVRVCKVISKARADRMRTPHERVREEFAVLKRLDHPHVVRIFEDFEDERYFYLVMEPCRGGDLLERVKSPHTRDAAEWELWVASVMQQTLSAVAYCHSKGIIHKDLKPENVMMSSTKTAPLQELHVVVVDFGLSQMFSNPTDRGTEIAGTPPFMAPEVWAGSFGKGCDVWSCGVMLFFMLSGTYPFMASRLEDFQRVVDVEPDWQRISGASAEANWSCWHMLRKNEAERQSAQELLRDPWFGGQQGLSGAGGGHGLAARGLLQVRKRSPFERFVSRLVATQLDAGQQRMVNEAFRAFDVDKDGALSPEELQRGLQMLGAKPEEAKQVVNDLDVGRTGRISYTEFLAGVLDLRSMSPPERNERLWLVWQQFSPDEQGLVNTNDIQAALAARGMTVAEMPQAFLRQLRRGSSRNLCFADFKSLFQGDESCCLMSSFVGSLQGNPGRKG